MTPTNAEKVRKLNALLAELNQIDSAWNEALAMKKEAEKTFAQMRDEWKEQRKFFMAQIKEIKK